MQRIREWMAANPIEAPRLRATNRSYVFFRDHRPVERRRAGRRAGRAAHRRCARSRSTGSHVYGTPFFIDAELADRQRRAGHASSAG